MKDDGKAAAEVVIIRRGGGDDAAGAKGGAWKIAYADFVTAMMAFFLVMWLINASNEETRAQVASYFNPIKLTDTTTGARSLKDLKDNRNTQKIEKADSRDATQPSKKDIHGEAELLADPIQSLDHVVSAGAEAGLTNVMHNNSSELVPSLKVDRDNPGVGDPFDPRSWESLKKADEPAKPADDVAGESRSNAIPDNATHIKQSKSTSQVDDIKKGIDAALVGEDHALNKSVEVKHVGNGILISLTESETFEMFRTGSAEPDSHLIKLVQVVAQTLKSRPGRVVVRGHTDSRPYRNKYYDNWQLSTARAHLARYMLIRGGLDEKRIWRVEGLADREPRNGTDPQAAENRRIDILLQDASP